MTLHDFVVLGGALLIAVVGILWIEHEGRKLDREMAKKPPPSE